jgi:hypothetical protein
VRKGQGRNLGRARRYYRPRYIESAPAYRDFFALWKDADADLPVLVEAKKEYKKLN